MMMMMIMIMMMMKVKDLVTGEERIITTDLIFLTGIREQEPRVPEISKK